MVLCKNWYLKNLITAHTEIVYVIVVAVVIVVVAAVVVVVVVIVVVVVVVVVDDDDPLSIHTGLLTYMSTSSLAYNIIFIWIQYHTF